MVGIVIVSHSAMLAEGLRTLAGAVSQERVRLAVAAGIEGDEAVLGTDPLRIVEAIREVWSPDGVLVLMDLGSALLSAEMALELLSDEERARVRLGAAPLVEGAVAAVARAAGGDGLEAVEAEAMAALEGKRSQLGAADVGGAGGASAASSRAGVGEPEERVEARAVVRDRFGLHARPAARLVAAAGEAASLVDVTLRNVTRRRGPASARSLSQLMALGVRPGDEIALSAVVSAGCDGAGKLREMLGVLDVGEVASAGGRREAVDVRDAPPTGEPREVPREMVGVPAGGGIAVGPARVRRAPKQSERRRTVRAERLMRPEAEWARLEEALDKARMELHAIQADTASRAGAEAAEIFAAHALLLRDPALLERARSLVDAGCGAREAWLRALEESRSAWLEVDDAYLRERVADLDDVARRVAGHVEGTVGDSAASGVGSLSDEGLRSLPVSSGDPPAILVAADLSPSEAATLRPEDFAGICLAGGTPTSHAAILAKARGVPAVVGLGPTILGVPEGTRVAMDGSTGRCWIDPEEARVAELERMRRLRAAAILSDGEAASEPAWTVDGLVVSVMANVGSLAEPDVAGLAASGADGVGLLRTEFLFLDRAFPPGEDEQCVAYDTIAGALRGRPLVIRTVDIGGDKPVPFLDAGREPNPFLGWRGIRQSLDTMDVFETQVRAVLRTAAGLKGGREAGARTGDVGGPPRVRLMFPMVASPDEVRAAREVVARARASLDRDGLACGEVEVGIMIEVPAAALQADAIAPLVRFFSIGTNDLTQYVMAADRTHPRLGRLLDPLEPAVLRLIARTAEAAGRHGIPVAVCGEAAGDPVAIPVLLGLGVRELSVSPLAVAGVKAHVRRWSVERAKVLAGEALGLESAGAVRELVRRRRQFL